MAQLKDTIINGNLEVTDGIILQSTDKGIQSVHPNTGEATKVILMNEYGDIAVGYDGYVNQNGNSHIYGNDIIHYVAMAGNVNYRPYYRAGDVIDFNVRTSGYVTNSGTYVVFTIPITKPVIGTPKATVTSNNGFILRQNNKYTHGSKGDVNPVIYAKPTSYDVLSNYNGGFVITAIFDITTDAVNNNPIGILWDGTITLS